MSKRLNLFAGTLGAAAGLVGFGYYWLMRRPLPKSQGSIRLESLSAAVEIFFDSWGVPHIYAKTEHDALFSQGYVHAQERLFQMDFNRRLGSGRLSEVLGQTALPLDRWMRIIGLRRAAVLCLDVMDNAERSAAEAYAMGVNARIVQGRLPAEFTLLRYKPEPWNVLDQITWSKMMAWNLSVNWESELLRLRLLERLGAEKARDLEPADYSGWPTIIPAGLEISSMGRAAQHLADAAKGFLGPSARSGIGSNNWVISSQRSKTGMPLLANDMHLLLTAPAIWYENHLVGGDLEVSGVSFPGVPYVIAGHNAQVAWGFTNGFPDVQDLYIEKLRRRGDEKVEYLYQDQWMQAEIIKETIAVKDRPSVDEEVVITRHGPVINALAPDFSGEQPLALRWTALEADNMLHALHRMNHAQDCLDFRDALRDWAAPVQNVVYADRQGNIAYSFPGKVPVRSQGDGRLPVPGWSGEYEWSGYIPFEDLPHLSNPSSGYLVSANNRVLGDEYPYFLGVDHASGSRAQRITELIEAKSKLDTAYIGRMQLDQISPSARLFAGAFSEVQSSDPELQAVINRLKDWDGHLAADSAEAAIYEVLVLRLLYRLLNKPLGDLTIRYAGKGPTPVLAEGSMMGEHAREWLRKILSEPSSPWFEPENGRTREQILLDALSESVNFLKDSCGPGIDDWAWGKIHQLTFSHPLSTSKPLEKLFNRGPFPLGGDFDTIWATGSSLHDLSYEQVIGPPYRFIADLSDWNNSLSVLVPGQSGHPASQHYADQVKSWFNGKYHPMLFIREKIESSAVNTLVLQPKLLSN